MEVRGGASCCGVSGFLIGPSIASDGGRLLHNSFSYPDTRGESRKDTEILLRNNSDVAVHIPSDQDVPDSVDGSRRHDDDDEVSKSGCCCSNGHVPGLAYVRQAAQRLLRDPMLSTRVTIVAMLAILVTVMTVLVWYFSTSHGEKAVSKVVDALRNELHSRAEGTIGYLSRDNNVSTAALARILSSPLISSNFSSFTTFTDQIAPILFTAFSVIPRKSLVSFYGKNGLFVSYSTEFNDTSMVFGNSTYLSPEANSTAPSSPWDPKENLTASRPWYQWSRQSADSATGLPVGPVTSVSPLAYWDIDLFNNTWNNVNNGGAAWGIVAPQSSDLLFLSLAPVKRSSDIDAVGVAAVGFSMSEIGEFFKTLDLQGGEIYITTEHGRLLVQTNAAVDYEIDDTGIPLLPLASNSTNTVVAGAAEYLSSVLGSQGTKSFQANSVRIDGKMYVVSSAPIQIAESALVCVILIPRDSLWGSSDKQSHTIFALLLILAICVGLVGCLFIVLLTKGISNEKCLREALYQQEEATKEAENRSNQKSIVFASMSHDLRTPLAAILGLIDLCLCDAVGASELESNLSQMKSCATNLLGILNSILDMSKIEAGKLQLEEAEFDLLDVLEEAVEMFAVVGMKKGLDVVLDFPDDSIERASRVMGDAGRVKQILSNMLSNAVKFTATGHVVLRAWQRPVVPISLGTTPIQGGGVFGCFYGWFWRCFNEREKNAHMAEEADSASGNLVEYEFEVDDTGKGIPRERRRAVFENFVQADSTVPRTHGGTGLGLGIVRSLVRLMGGDINIVDKDDPNEPGARFKFSLFFQRPQDSTPAHSHPFSPAQFRLKPQDTIASRYGIRSPGGPFNREHMECRKHPTPGSVQSPSIYSPRYAEGVHVLLAVQGQAGRKMTKGWMERRGLHVWTVCHPEDFFETLERIKFEVFYEESFNWSDCFEVSPGNQPYETWADDNLIHPPGGELSELSATPSSTYVKNYGDRGGPRLLLVIDAAMVSNVFNQLCASLSNSLSNADISAASRVVWLVTPVTPSSVLQTLKQGTVPCDLMLHKPLNVSRLRIVWEQVQLLVQNSRDLDNTLKPSPNYTVSRGESPLTVSQPLVPYPSPMPGGAGGSEKDSKEGSTADSGTLSNDQLAGRNVRGDLSASQSGNPSASQSATQSTMPTPSRATNLEGAPGLHVSSSPSPDIGPFPRVRPRETDFMGAPNSLQGMHILVAEDNPVLQRLTKTTLLRLGATVECVDNGLEAVQLVLANLPRKNSSRSSSFGGSFRRLRNLSREQEEEDGAAQKKRPFDMVLMDCQMPVLDGYDATQRIREQEKVLGFRTPVIALTAHAMAKDESKCIRAGMDFYLTKPLATKALLNVVAKVNANNRPG
ncbi:hypothetical protein R1sor_011585 [Riccia sorocarpa]|uniref:histidine kinase n=1 Tax=Riccia sorocarpa TaxID=122646 RepID=A0ABD3I362_9MARC